MRKFFCFILLAAFGNAQSQSSDSTELCFASDTQAPMWVETLFLKKNNNKQATKKMFATISERRPGALFIMGDVVNLGYSNRQWRPMDVYLKDLRSKNIEVYAALGNHEVMGQAKKGMRKFQERFPEHKPTGYVQVKDSIAVILLNSNFGKLSTEENAAQVKWYKETLKELDADSSIHFIISGCHHSPFTNSKIVGANKDVQEKFVPLFLASKKSRLFITGHSHNFEHFKKNGKDFLVIGGGGGLHQPLRTGEDCTADLAQDYKPDFHYLTVKRMGHQLKVASIQMKKDFSCFEDGQSMVITKEAIPVSNATAAN
ncbi:MAG TPA: metallophosphoesterase [Flavisolibacter sp.]